MSSKNSTQYHRVQISRAKDFIRNNLVDSISLAEIAETSGVSQYHFIRVFSAYTGETPFEYQQRLKIVNSLELLKSTISLIEVSGAVGYENQSSFNKAFKKWTSMSPSEFRNLGKEEQDRIQYDLGMNAKQKEQSMNLKLSEKPEVVIRPQTKVLTLKGIGHNFTELAPLTWQKFFEIVARYQPDFRGAEYLGLSYVTTLEDVHNHEYKVAITVPDGREINVPGLAIEVMPMQKYLKFVLVGPYQGVWPAFDNIFRYVSENSLKLAAQPCIENYLNDPNVTPESELITELLIPICDQ